MKRLLAAVALVVAASSMATAGAATPRAPRIAGWLHTSGTRILDSKSREVRFVSVNVTGLESTNDEGSQVIKSCNRGWRAPSQRAAQNLAAWGFNTVRLPVAWGNLEPAAPAKGADRTVVHRWNEPYLRALDSAIAGYRANEIAVILDMHQWFWSYAFPAREGNCVGLGMPVWLNPQARSEPLERAKCDFFSGRTEPGVPIDAWQGFTDAWRLLAARYAKDPTVVALDIFNEPWLDTVKCPGQRLDALYRQVGTAIRKVSTRALLVFEDSNDLGGRPLAIRAMPPVANAVYSYHVYRPGWEPEGRQVVERYTARAKAWNVPVWMGEFNGFGAAHNVRPVPANALADTKALVTALKALGQGWAFWAYYGADGILPLGSDQPKPDLLAALQAGF